MSKKKSLFLSLSLVLIVGLSIVAGTFAYFQWQAATGTQVNVTIEMGGITMNIEPEDTEFVGLYPTAHCINNVRYGDALVTIENKTGALAIPSFKLKVAVNPSVPDTGKLNDYKDNIHYAVVALETNKDGSKKLSNGNVRTVGGNTIDELVTGTCSAPLNVSNTGDNDNTFKSDYGKTATGLFDVITAENTFADTAFLPREYNSTTGKVQGVTFRGEAYSTSYQWYRVYVWIDENYTTTIIGNEVTDPLQNAQISVTWSENSMLQQVSGESIVDTGLEPGLYDNDGNMVSTWDELVSSNKIVLDGNTINSSQYELSGKLVIKEGITGICSYSFMNSSINEILIPSSVEYIDSGAFLDSSLRTVTFEKNSQLAYIGDWAFSGTNITNIEIPAKVDYLGENLFLDTSLETITFEENSRLNTIGASAFEDTNITSIELSGSLSKISSNAFFNCALLDTITFIGTVEQWTAIIKDEFWGLGTSLGKIVCFDGDIDLVVAGLYDENDDLIFSWLELIENGYISRFSGYSYIESSNFSGLSGKLVIPEGVMSIGSGAFTGTTLNSFVLPSTISGIGNSTFASSSIVSLTFNGTMAQWEAIDKYDGWNDGISATKVVCSDGEVLLENGD